MKKSLLTLLFLLVCGFVAAQTTDEKAINKIVDDYGKAIVAKDSVALGKLLSADCKMTDPGSQTFDKQGIVNVFCNKTYNVSKFNVTNRINTPGKEVFKSVVTADIGVMVNAEDMSKVYVNAYTFKKEGGQWLISEIAITTP